MIKLEKFNIYEAPTKVKKVVFAFGRFNPPTIGHEKLIDKVKKVAGSDDYGIYPSYSKNQKTDPLPHALKIAYMRKMFPRYSRNIVADKNAITVMDIAVSLYEQGYTDLTMVAGSDRLREFKTLLTKYNNVKGKRHGFYNFNNIKIVNAGERDPDSEGVTGMSASKMRQAAVDGKVQDFESGLPKSFRDGRKLYRDVRKHMGIREEKDMGEMTNYEQLRDLYLTGKIWNIGDIVETKGVEGEIVQRGTNYIAFKDDNNKIQKAWLHDIAEDLIESPIMFPKLQNWIKRNVTAKKRVDSAIEYYKQLVKKGDPKNISSKVAQLFGFDYREFADMIIAKGLKVENDKVDSTIEQADKKGIPYSIMKKMYDSVNLSKTETEALSWPNEYADHTRKITPGQGNKLVKVKKTKLTKENIKEWYNSEDTRLDYIMRYSTDWQEKLDITHNRMLESLEVDTKHSDGVTRVKSFSGKALIKVKNQRLTDTPAGSTDGQLSKENMKKHIFDFIKDKKKLKKKNEGLNKKVLQNE